MWKLSSTYLLKTSSDWWQSTKFIWLMTIYTWHLISVYLRRIYLRQNLPPLSSNILDTTHREPWHTHKYVCITRVLYNDLRKPFKTAENTSRSGRMGGSRNVTKPQKSALYLTRWIRWKWTLSPWWGDFQSSILLWPSRISLEVK